MSSSTYSARIYPDNVLRLSVLGIAAVFGAVGAWIIVGLPWPAVFRWLLGTAWLALLSFDAFRLGRRYSNARLYVIHPGGDVDVASRRGRTSRARLAAGTTVYAGLAWLRFRHPGGGSWGELVCRPAGGDKRLKNKDWRRLQVICRHLSAC